MTDELNPFVYDDPLPPDALIDRDEELTITSSSALVRAPRITTSSSDRGMRGGVETAGRW